MRKIGIVTMWFGGANYGGTLQAYALAKTLNNLGYEAEQIRFSANKSAGTKEKLGFSLRLKIKIRRTLDGILYGRRNKINEKIINRRTKAFEEFQSCIIPHSSKVYSYENIQETLSRYDMFVTGSDQVWNPRFYSRFYRLDFVPSNVPKFSYAASMSVEKINKEEAEVFKTSLKDYVGVSVREKNSISLLKSVSPVEPVLSLDPTLLCGQEEWDEVSCEKIIEEPYMLCIFLGVDEKYCKLSREYAKKLGLKIVSIPWRYFMAKKKYSDKIFFDATPGQFISLIKHAKVIMTDSFHVSAFSCIYRKEFFAFRRNQFGGMSSRLKTLTEIFGVQERFCNCDEMDTLSYLESRKKLSYSNFEEFEALKAESMKYLRETLDRAEKKIKEEPSK